MIKISIDDSLRTLCSTIRIGWIHMEVSISPCHQGLVEFIDSRLAELRQSLSSETLREKPTITAARKAYKQFGKDPSRYRLSAEALSRRIIGGKDLYQINNVIDLLNLISIQSGCSIGGYDADRIQGDIILKLGVENHPYQAIGRGLFNIKNLPVLYDDLGPFGNPSSDSERTKVTNNTKRFLMVFFDFGADQKLELWMNDFIQHSLRFEIAKVHQFNIVY